MANKLTRKRPNRLLTGRNNYFLFGSLMNLNPYSIDFTSNAYHGYRGDVALTSEFIKGANSLGAGISLTDMPGSLGGNSMGQQIKSSNKPALTNLGKVAIGAGALIVGQIGGSLISGGMDSTAGNAISDIGSTVGGAISTVNPLIGGIVSGASLIVGGGINRIFGSKMNTENIAKVEANINNLNNFQSNASDFDTLSQNWANADVGMTFSDSFIGKDGRFSNKAKNKAADLRRQVEAGNAWVQNSLNNNALNIGTTQMQNLLANYAAFGGPLFAEGGRIHIRPENRGKFTETKRRTGKTTEELTHSKNPVTRKRAIFAQNAKKWHHAFGGDLMTHGADFDTGLTLVGNGGTHEENPNEGVPMGMDSEGIPNLVEEGEVIFNDYVFSKRLRVPKAVRKKYKLRGTKPLTFADAALQMSKEAEERPNDPISQRGLEAGLQTLMAAQEQQREEKNRRMYAQGGTLIRRFDGTGDQPNFLQLPTWYDPLSAPTTPVVTRNLMEVDPIEKLIRRYNLTPEQATALKRALPGSQHQREVVKSNPASQRPKRGRGKNRYNLEWYNKQARKLGISPEELNFSFVGDDEENLAEFNRLATDYRRAQLQNDYNSALRQRMFNADLDRGAYRRATGDSDKYYRANTWDTSGSGWVNSDWKYNPTKPTEGILDDEAYSELDEKERAKYKRLTYNAGDRVLDYNGAVSWGTDPLTADLIKEGYTPTGFKFDETKDGINVEFPQTNGYNALTALRYVPALGAGVGVFSDLMGWTNKPDYTPVETILQAGANSSQSSNEVKFNPIGNYLTYTPFDRDYHINQLNAQSGATRRSILNTVGGNRGAAIAGLLAADYSAQNSLGNLARQAEEYNLAQRQKVAEFNRGTNMFNSENILKADMANQAVRNSNRELLYKSNIAAAELRLKIDAQASAGRAANLTNLFNSLGNIGREEVMKSWINENPALYYAVSTGGKGTPYTASLANGGYLTIKRKRRKK